jgi:hypothetical protein
MKNLYVIDNGKSYSDHQIHFVSTTQPRYVVEAVQGLIFPEGKLLGYGYFEWWEGGVSTLEGMLGEAYLYAGNCEDAEAMRALAKTLPDELQKVVQWELDNL